MFGKGPRPLQAAPSVDADLSRTRETRRVIEARVDDIGEFFHRDFRWVGNFGCGSKNELREFRDNRQRPFQAAYSEMVSIDEARLFMGECAAAFGRQEAVDSGKFFGIKPTGKRAEMRYMDLWKVIGAKIANNWLVVEFPHVLSQLGLGVFEGKGRDAFDRGKTAAPMPGSESGAGE